VRDFGQSGLAARTVVEVQIASKEVANTKPKNLDIRLSLHQGAHGMQRAVTVSLE
jgi:hypothetical protein